jgi:hypothetical protein
MKVSFGLGRITGVLASCLSLFACSDPSRPAEPFAARVEIVSGNDQSGVVGKSLAQPLIARVTDVRGAPVTNQAVEFRVTAGGGSLTESSTVTDQDGTATARWELGHNAADAQSIEVRAIGVEGGPVASLRAIFHAIALPDIPANIVATNAEPRSGHAGAPLPVRQCKGRGDGQMAGEGRGRKRPPVNECDRCDRAREHDVDARLHGRGRSPAPGRHGSRPRRRGRGRGEVAAGAAVTKSGGDGQSGPVTGQLATPLEVRLVGPGGSPISGAAVTWSANAAVGQITPLSSVTNADGRASARITLGRNVGAHQVTARIADLSPVSFGVTTTACPVASVTIVQGNGQSGVAGSALGTPLIVRVADGAGNPVVGAAVTWEGAGSVTPSTTASNAQGQVSVIWTPANASGT